MFTGRNLRNFYRPNINFCSFVCAEGLSCSGASLLGSDGGCCILLLAELKVVRFQYLAACLYADATCVRTSREIDGCLELTESWPWVQNIHIDI